MLGTLFKRVTPSDRRRNSRIYDRPLKVRVEGKTYKTHDWSLGGFRIKHYHRHLEVGERISGKISLPRGPKAGDIVVEVMRATDNGDVGVRFLEITPRIFVAMGGLKAC